MVVEVAWSPWLMVESDFGWLVAEPTDDELEDIGPLLIYLN